MLPTHCASSTPDLHVALPPGGVAVVPRVRVAGPISKSWGRMDSEELRISKLTVRIDRLICVSFETCVEVAPDLFQLDEDGIAIFTADAAGASADLVLESCGSCPVDALQVLDESGNQLVP